MRQEPKLCSLLLLEVLVILQLRPNEVDAVVLLLHDAPPKPTLKQRLYQVAIVASSNPRLILPVAPHLAIFESIHVDVYAIREVQLEQQLPIALNPCIIDRVLILRIHIDRLALLLHPCRPSPLLQSYCVASERAFSPKPALHLIVHYYLTLAGRLLILLLRWIQPQN